MPPLTDPELLGDYKNALANWRYDGFIRFSTLAEEWLRAKVSNATTREIGRLMHEHVAKGGEIDQQKETRPEWSSYDYHFDFRLSCFSRRIYIETRLFYDDPNDPDDPVIHVVNIHDV